MTCDIVGKKKDLFDGKVAEIRKKILPVNEFPTPIISVSMLTPLSDSRS